MDKLNESLDQTVLEIFQVLEDLYKKQASLEQVLKDGFFSMARARYNIGVKRVTADQIVDADLTASRTVLVNNDICDAVSCLNIEDEDEEDAKNIPNVPDVAENLFTMCDNDMTTVTTDSNNDKDGTVKSESGVRKRVTAESTAEEDKEWEEVKKMIGEKDDNKRKLKNPINLFGVLVPQALRSSQKNFEDAVRISVEIGNEKNKLKILERKYKALQVEKSKFSRCDNVSSSGEKES